MKTFKNKVHDTTQNILTPLKIFCNKFGKFGKSKSLASSASLTKFPKTETVSTEFSVGEQCTALCYEDSTWYNAKVEAIIEDVQLYMFNVGPEPEKRELGTIPTKV